MDNHSDSLQDDHRAPPPCIRPPSPAGQLLYIPAVPASPREQQQDLPTTSMEDGENSTTKKLYRRITNGYHRVRDHVNMGPELSKLMKGKLLLGTRIIQKGGRENLFKELFGENESGKLLKASQCYLFTTEGPIAGILFISTKKVAFCSDRSITLHLGDITRQLYKEEILINKIKEVNDRKVGNPSQEYIQIVTHNSFEYWFMGFVRYEKALHNLRKAHSFNSN